MLLRVIVFLCIAVVVGLTARKLPFFRKDYVYVKSFNSFYKIHPPSTNVSEWTTAFETCEDDGTQLFYPRTIQEIAVIKNLTQNLTIPEFLVGFHDPYHSGVFIAVDGSTTPIPILNKNEEIDSDERCVTMDIDKATFKITFCDSPEGRAFACRKIDNLDPCPTVDKGYVHDRSMDRCYKFHSRPRRWHDAWKTCYMEGAKLLVIDDEHEMRVITNRIAAREEQAYYIGFHRVIANGDLYTVNETATKKTKKSPNHNITVTRESKLRIRNKYLMPIILDNSTWTRSTTRKPILTYVPDLLALRMEQEMKTAIDENLSANKNYSWYLPSKLRNLLRAKVEQISTGIKKISENNNQTTNNTAAQPKKPTPFPNRKNKNWHVKYIRPTIVSNFLEEKTRNDKHVGGYICYACRNLVNRKTKAPQGLLNMARINGSSKYLTKMSGRNETSQYLPAIARQFEKDNGLRLKVEGFSVWRDKINDSKEDCGIIDKTYFKTQSCNISSPFICEMETAVDNPQLLKEDSKKG